MNSRVIINSAWFALCQQGFPLAAEAAIAKWEQGTTFELEPEVHLPRFAEDLILQANWEVERISRVS